MRLRNETLTTGRLLAHFDAGDRSHNQSLLFLVVGASDIESLTRIEEASRASISQAGLSGFEWHAVPDQGQLTSIEPNLTPSRLARLEVAELADLTSAELQELLGPALARMAAGRPELFPSAGGAVGAPAEGIQLLGREREISELARLLAGGANILLVAPRRSGKTSVLRRLEKELNAQWQTAYLDLERDLSAADMAARLWVLAAKEPIRAAQQRAHADWQSLFSAALRRLRGSETPRKVVLLLDELVYFLENLVPAGGRRGQGRERVLAFLQSLSNLCMPADIQVVVAGSLELGEYLRDAVDIREHELPPLFRSLVTFPLPLPSFSSARLEMRRVLLGTGLVVTREELDWLTENADLASPFAALRFLDRLATRARTAGIAGPSALEAALESFLDATEAFEGLAQRLQSKSRELPGARAALEEALDLLARTPGGTGLELERFREPLSRTRPAETDQLLAWLLETFPLRREGDRVLFASGLFRRWWRRQLVTADQAHLEPEVGR
jgi:AAA ATPase domain